MNKSEMQAKDKRSAFGLVALYLGRPPEKRNFLYVALCICLTPVLFATDGISPGPDRYECDFSTKHDQYKITGEERRWASTMKGKLKQTGKTVYFVRTDIPLTRNGSEMKGHIYQRTDQPEVFYVPDCNVAVDLRIGTVCVVPGVRVRCN